MNKHTSMIAGFCLLAVGGFLFLAFNIGQQSTADRSPEPSQQANRNDSANLTTLPTELRTELAQLRTEQDESRREREALQDELANLQEQMTTLQDDLQADRNAFTEAKEIAHGNDPSSAGAVTGASTNASRFGFGSLSDDDRQSSLQAAGVDDQTIASIAERRDQFELVRLELFDRATRDGLRGTDQFREELDQLEDSRVSIRDEIGDDAYDKYLINAGRDNRVTIESVINGSAASIAGIQAGDIIYSYAGSRVFNTRELQQATREGTRGELIDIEVERINEGQQFYSIERGPMGVTLGSVLDTP